MRNRIVRTLVSLGYQSSSILSVEGVKRRLLAHIFTVDWKLMSYQQSTRTLRTKRDLFLDLSSSRFHSQSLRRNVWCLLILILNISINWQEFVIHLYSCSIVRESTHEFKSQFVKIFIWKDGDISVFSNALNANKLLTRISAVLIFLSKYRDNKIFRLSNLKNSWH